jgi:hypothetical protein
VARPLNSGSLRLQWPSLDRNTSNIDLQAAHISTASPSKMPQRRSINPDKDFVEQENDDEKVRVHHTDAKSQGSQLQDDDKIVKIYPTEGCTRKPFPVEKTLLASVTTKLANHCISRTTNSECQLPTESEVLRVLFNWVLRCSLHINDQTTLVQAWRFGHEWEIPVFQNEVKRYLVHELGNDRIDTCHVRNIRSRVHQKESP